MRSAYISNEELIRSAFDHSDIAIRQNVLYVGGCGVYEDSLVGPDG